MPSAFALSGASVITTSPIAVDLFSAPGTSTSTTLQVQNNGVQPIQVNVKLEEFKANGTGGDATFFNPPAGDKSTSWVHFSTTSFSAQPNIWVPIQMTINVPKDASLGYYYAVLFTPQNVITSAKTSAKYKGANAVYVLLDTNSKNEAKSLFITNFTANKKIFSFLPVNFNIEVDNPGNIFIAPQGDIYISRKPSGRTIDTIPINTSGNNILPNSSRVFTGQWSDGFPSYSYKRINGQIVSNSKGQPIQELNWNFSSPLSKFRFGKYYANLAIVYNNGSFDVPITGIVSFWVIPWQLILEIVVGITIIIVLWKLVSRTIRKLWRKALKKEQPKKAPKKPNKRTKKQKDVADTKVSTLQTAPSKPTKIRVENDQTSTI
jgi:hypothetical protein